MDIGHSLFGYGGVMSYLPLILIVVLAIAASAFGRGKNSGGAVLVLNEFKLNQDEDEFLKIVGRASGFLGWVLSLFGIDPVTSLTCNRKMVKFEEAAIRFGKNTVNIPLASVAAVATGIYKPFIYLVFGVLLILGGIIFTIISRSFVIFFIGAIIGIIFIIFYKLKKTMMFSIYCGGDKPIAIICMKKSIIEGQNIDESKYEAAANALNKAVLDIRC